ncbi:ribosome recycling factor [Skeletonema marinoi]|uniref:Ribosome recycling factor n=1 Tax=Skeletonema marinoi TaxID=267567 RepID=A0AAD8Y1D2_9STRA|nr:ribosome recycling factor [Skeletonema marinoi]
MTLDTRGQRDRRAINQQKPRLKHTTTTYLNQYTYYSIMKLSTAFFVASAVCSSVSGFTAVPSGNACQRIITANQPSAAASRYHASTTTLQMSQEEMELITMDANERMDKTMSNLAENLSTVRTGRANPNMLDRVEADYYGAMTPINQMATISVPSSQQLQIAPFDKSSLVDIEKAIIYAGLGFTPSNDGNVIRINIPTLTEDRPIGEEAKVAIQNIRRDGVDSIKKRRRLVTWGRIRHWMGKMRYIR